MREVIWSDDALRDFTDGIRHIAQTDAHAAGLVADRIDAAVTGLSDWSTGHPGRVTGTPDKVVPNTSYIIAYALPDESVMTLRVIHGRRHWPAKNGLATDAQSPHSVR